ncbi:MAG TPA: SRPBCC domain-containing protein, partial [Gemmatimonadales bacterium]|nr:SRPBCC domain-containing protein [Gemmatimonadales bacterium]
DKVWRALTEPAELHEWAPFDADASLGRTGALVKLTTVGAPSPLVAETRIIHADAPRLLEYDWSGGHLRWQLEPMTGGTRLTLGHHIDRRFISMGAAGWHICLDVLDHLLGGDPIGRMAGPVAFQFDWSRLNREYAAQFGVAAPEWPPTAG